MTKFTITILFIYFSTILFSQNYKGIVLDKDNKIIPYVTVSITNDSSIYGLMTNADGTFNIKQSAISLFDSLGFSCVGYKSKKILISNLSTNKHTDIVLQKQIYDISEVVIKANEKCYTETVGTHRRISSMGTYMHMGMGWQIALYIENPKKEEGILKTVKIKLTKGKISSAPVKIRVYSVLDPYKEPQEDLLLEPVLARPHVIKKDCIIVNVEKYQIAVPKEGIFVGVECLPTEKMILEKDIMTYFKSRKTTFNQNSLFIDRCYIRKNDRQRTWTKGYIDYPPKRKAFKWYLRGKVVGHAKKEDNVKMGADIIYCK